MRHLECLRLCPHLWRAHVLYVSMWTVSGWSIPAINIVCVLCTDVKLEIYVCFQVGSWISFTLLTQCVPGRQYSITHRPQRTTIESRRLHLKSLISDLWLSYFIEYIFCCICLLKLWIFHISAVGISTFLGFIQMTIWGRAKHKT